MIDEMRKALASALPQRAEQQLGPRGLHMLPHQSAPFYFEASLDRGYINNSIWLSSMVFFFYIYIHSYHLLLKAPGELETIRADLRGPR